MHVLLRFVEQLRDALGAAIPSLIELLKHQDHWVRSVAATELGKLAEHGELPLDAIVACLTRYYSRAS
jgi:HEAT repeat protein